MKAPLTAETITDKQIDALRVDAGTHGDMVLVGVCATALDAPMGSLRRVTARGRCAEILNERAKEQP